MKLSTRTALIAAAALPLAATIASAQYRVDNSSARDANNRLGSGGYNDGAFNTRIGGLAGNLIVTGNVTDAKSFRGSLGYTAPSAFRGNLGSASFDTFLRDSSGINALRGGYARDNMATLQPYFGAGQTVAPPPGTVRDISRGGAYVPQGPAVISPGDSRLDLGGATRAQVAQTYIADQRAIGGAGLSSIANSSWTNTAAGTGAIQLSAYTQVGRAQAILGTNNSLANATSVIPANGLAAGAVPGNSIADQPNTLNGTPLNTTRDIADLRVNGVRDAAERNASNEQPAPDKAKGDEPSSLIDPNSPGYTGQGRTIRSLRAIQNNPQYAELRNRFESRQQKPGDNRPGVNDAGNAPTTPPIPGARADERAGGPTGERVDGRADSARPTDTRIDPTAKPGDATTPGGIVSGPIVGEGAKPIAPSAEKPVPDKLNLPRPEGDPAAQQPDRPQNADRAPMLITSLASGVKDKNLAAVLTEAEQNMQSGRFGSAIDAFGRAETIADDDPLVFMGRGIAELGGSYYRKAEVHLRQAYAGDESLLGAKFDLRKMLTDDRLNFLINDLGEVAKTNPNDPGPLVLLSFIYYNGGMEDRAARALELAQERAKGDDALVKKLQANWQLTPAESATPTPTKTDEAPKAEELNK